MSSISSTAAAAASTSSTTNSSKRKEVPNSPIRGGNANININNSPSRGQHPKKKNAIVMQRTIATKGTLQSSPSPSNQYNLSDTNDFPSLEKPTTTTDNNNDDTEQTTKHNKKYYPRRSAVNAFNIIKSYNGLSKELDNSTKEEDTEEGIDGTSNPKLPIASPSSIDTSDCDENEKSSDDSVDDDEGEEGDDDGHFVCASVNTLTEDMLNCISKDDEPYDSDSDVESKSCNSDTLVYDTSDDEGNDSMRDVKGSFPKGGEGEAKSELLVDKLMAPFLSARVESGSGDGKQSKPQSKSRKYPNREQVGTGETATMLEMFNPDTRAKAKLAMAIVESSAVSSGLKPTVEGCYSFEGDGPMILQALSIFERLDNSYNFDNIESDIEDAIDIAIPMLKSVEQSYNDEYTAAKKEADDSATAVTLAKNKLAALTDSLDGIRNSNSSRGRARKKTSKSLDDDELSRMEELVSEVAAVKVELKHLTKVAKKKKDASNEKRVEFEEWKSKFPFRTYELLLEHVKSILAPAGDYFREIFGEGGECHHMRQMAEAAQIFNPIFLSKLSDEDIVSTLSFLADKLSAFGYRHFNERFIEKLKEEMPKVVASAKRDHDLDKLKPSDRYKTRLQRRIKRLNKTNSDADWRDDPGEYAERIWQWWKHKEHFKYHYTALRLVVLAQLSSCSVERVFSRLKYIRDNCGENMLEDMCEIRLMLQCNGELDNLCKLIAEEEEGE